MNKRMRELLQKKERVVEEARGILEPAEAQGRDLSASEQTAYDKLLAEAGEISEKVKREEKKAEAERNAPVIQTYGQDGRLRQVANYIATGRHFSGMFPTIAQSNDGFDTLGEYMAAIFSGRHDPRLIEASATGASEGVGADGGFLVPTEYTAGLMDASLEAEVVRPRARVEPMMSNSRVVAGFNTQDHSSSIGGFTGQWLDEGGTLNTQKGLIRPITMKAHKLGILAPVTNELIADSPYFENDLRTILIKAIGWYMDLAFLIGDGVGKPRGVLNDPALITVAKESGQTADTITYENIKAMFARLHPASVNNAVWVANANTRVQLLSMVQYIQNAAGTDNVGGSYIPVMRDNGQGGFTMLGIPVIFTEKVPQLGDTGDIMLVDFSQYTIGMRSEMTLDRSGHVGFTKDETYFRAILRVDGQGSWSQAVTPKNGQSLSWCVALAVRA